MSLLKISYIFHVCSSNLPGGHRDGRHTNAVPCAAAPEPIRVTTTVNNRVPRNANRRRSASGSTSTPRTESPTCRSRARPTLDVIVARRKPADREPRTRGHLAEGHPGEVGDTRVELPEPAPRCVVTHQTGPHHRFVQVDDPPASRLYRAIVRLESVICSSRSRTLARRRTPASAKPADHESGPRHRAAIRSPRSPVNPSWATPSEWIPGAHFTTTSRPQ